MKKMIVVFKREYLQAVRRKMFIFMTFAFPALMAALMYIPTMLMVRGLGEKHVAILDGTGKLHDSYLHPAAAAPKTDLQKMQKSRELPQSMQFEYVDHAADPKPYLARMTQREKDGKLDGVLLVPADALTNTDAHLKYYSRTATDIIVEERLSSTTNRAVQRFRLQAHGLDPDVLNRAMTEMTLDSIQLSKTGEEKKGGSANFIVGFVLCALLILPTIVSGLDVMRGIIQEKTDRVVEVLISSVTPSELLIGKILGTATVGLTQIGVWLIMLYGISTYGAMVFSVAGINISQFIRLQTFIYFPVFFLLAFLTYVCIYAIGGAACNSDREAQQLIAPITMVMFLPWFILIVLITNPDSTLSTTFSMSPVFGPMTMYVRTLVSDPPAYQIAVSILTSVATIAFFLWVTAKIFRVGILSYGKRPTIPELWRWMKVA